MRGIGIVSFSREHSLLSSLSSPTFLHSSSPFLPPSSPPLLTQTNSLLLYPLPLYRATSPSGTTTSPTPSAAASSSSSLSGTVSPLSKIRIGEDSRSLIGAFSSSSFPFVSFPFGQSDEANSLLSFVSSDTLKLSTKD